MKIFIVGGVSYIRFHMVKTSRPGYGYHVITLDNLSTGH
jgi:UDP-glucose 4-epimerase